MGRERDGERGRVRENTRQFIYAFSCHFANIDFVYIV